MPTLLNFSCSILVEGKPLREHKLQLSHNGTQVTCWIASETDKEFQIKYSDSLRTKTTASTAIIDGVDCKGKILYSRSARPKQSSNFVIQKGVRASSMSRRALVFSKCRLVEDDKGARTRGPPSTGEIKVFIDEVEVLQRSRRSNSVVLPSLQMSEKAKKGRVHGIKLGNTVALLSVPRKIYSVKRLCTFIFNYRPLEILMADGIIPRSPKKPITSAINFIDLTLEDEDDHASKTRGKLQSSMATYRTPSTKRPKLSVDSTVLDLTV